MISMTTALSLNYTRKKVTVEQKSLTKGGDKMKNELSPSFVVKVNLQPMELNETEEVIQRLVTMMDNYEKGHGGVRTLLVVKFSY